MKRIFILYTLLFITFVTGGALGYATTPTQTGVHTTNVENFKNGTSGRSR